MATTTTPGVDTGKKFPLNLTPSAISKVKEIMAQQNPQPAGLRVGVVGGGCSAGRTANNHRIADAHAASSPINEKPHLAGEAR
jgi:hypothetical protein